MVKVFSYSEIKASLKPKDQVEDQVIISYENYLSEILNSLNLLLDDLKANLIYNFVSDFWIILLDINHFQHFKTRELKVYINKLPINIYKWCIKIFIYKIFIILLIICIFFLLLFYTHQFILSIEIIAILI